jgi:magnesium transporter
VGIHQVDMMEKMGSHFGIHPLVIEDILNTVQRPKMDDMDGYLFFVLKMLNYKVGEDEIDAEQVSIILGQNVTFYTITLC